MENNNGNGKAGYFLLLGIGIGAVVSLLFAPRTGHEIRHAIREKTDKGREALGRRGQQLSEVARSAIDKGKEYIQGGQDTVSDAVDAAKQAYRETREEVRNEFSAPKSD
jgi:gas vesicle protein